MFLVSEIEKWYLAITNTAMMEYNNWNQLPFLF